MTLHGTMPPMIGAPTTGLLRFEGPPAMATIDVGTNTVPFLPKLPVRATRRRWR